MPNNLTDNEIVKALEDTLHRIKGAEHLIVPKEGVKNLCNGLQNALDLINRLQAENERLKEEEKKIQLIKDENDGLRSLLIRFIDKVGKLTNIDDVVNMSLIPLMTEKTKKFKAEFKSEAYKEFAERLKDNTREFGSASGIQREVDNLLKELVGE